MTNRPSRGGPDRPSEAPGPEPHAYTLPPGEASGGQFDYRSFEERLDGLVALESSRISTPRGASQWEQPAVDGPVRRATLDLRALPRDDAAFSLRELGGFTVLTVRGRINETFPGSQIGAKLRGRIVFDLTEVDRVTSFGVRSWLQMLDEAVIDEAYICRASPAVVHQITMMRSFCGPARIVSILAPYACGACGAEFGVSYHALEDRAVLLGRSPLRVSCPGCDQPVGMDEDPWVFFGLDEQLVAHVPSDLAAVIQDLAEAPRHAPIEKSMNGSTTAIQFHGNITAATRFQHAFQGLEGEVSLDLRSARDLTADGLMALLGRLHRLPRDVTSVTIEGATVPLIQALLTDRPALVGVRSVTTVAVHASGQRRNVTIDLEREGAALRRGDPLELELPWSAAETTIEGLPLLKRAALVLSGSSASAGAPVGPRLTLLWRLAVVLGVGAVGFGAVVVGFGLLLSAIPLVLGRLSGDEAPMIVADGRWSTGGVLPPGWVEVPVIEEGDQLMLAGRAIAPTVEEAARLARLDAAGYLMEELVRRSEIDGGIKPPPSRESPAWELVLARFVDTTSSTLPMVRSEEAARRVGDQIEVVARYSVPLEQLEALALAPGRSASFKGITVTQAPVWLEPGLIVTKTESYIKEIRPGARLEWIGSRAVDTLEAFEAATRSEWRHLPAGKTLYLIFEQDGGDATLPLSKPRRALLPAPDARPALLQAP
ncbi:MAG TPA: hypothetical protein ENK18_12230 [Deltaproteobacteria bacterium]|nr:hypothetical protein [Deltaproteobacteria bacterium]